MSDLVAWYRDEEEKKIFDPVETAALFHYRYIRIHPFEDGNGRIARLLVNYILLRNGYPMIVIPTIDRNNYLEILGKCDKITGTQPFDGANAAAAQIKPFIAYIKHFVEKKLILSIQFAKGEIMSFSESDVPDLSTDIQQKIDKAQNDVPENVTENTTDNFIEKRQQFIVNCIKMNNKISATEIAELLKVNPKTVKRDIQQLKTKGIVGREGTERGGHWVIKE
jgi:Fic family protein